MCGDCRHWGEPIGEYEPTGVTPEGAAVKLPRWSWCLRNGHLSSRYARCEDWANADN